MSETLRFVSDELQLMAMGFMAVVYILRIRWLKIQGIPRQAGPFRGRGASSFKGIVYSWANIAMPWSMESTRRMSFFYLQFVVFHLAVAANITMSLVIPYAPGLMKPMIVVRLLQSCSPWRSYRLLSYVPPSQQSIDAPDQHAG